MPLETKIVELGDIRITVRQADLRTGFRRGRMIRELVLEPDLNGTDPDLANVRYIYIDLACGTEAVEGMDWPVEVAAFEAFTDEWFDAVGWFWLQAVRDVNPHWDPSREADAQGEAPAAAG